MYKPRIGILVFPTVLHRLMVFRPVSKIHDPVKDGSKDPLIAPVLDSTVHTTAQTVSDPVIVSDPVKNQIPFCSISLNPRVCDGQEHKLLFVFGDSLFDAGNNKYLNSSMRVAQAYYPYGITFHNQSTGRVSDGLIVPDFIAKYGNLNMVPPYLQPGANFSDGVNFASAGSGVFDTMPGLISLPGQLTNFKKVASSLDKEVLKRSVFLISMGGNDYFSFNNKNPNATLAQRQQFQRMVVGNLTNALKEIYELGGRKFAFQNVGPLGCMPLMKQFYPQLNGSCSTNLLVHATMHNRALSNALKKLESRLTGFKYSIFDYYTALLDRINHASKYGFKEGIIACCGTGQFNGQNCGGGFTGKDAYNLCSNPSEYVFFDGGHTTEKANSQLAELIWSGVPNVTGPYNVQQLFELS
ncbi:GDSL esterase/lipase 1-like [Pistacia vera]|uniref:GDSL esterase/lipase 1-like n=1 Tax=Pistacia vera TaxID=55513 RepID=UPI0012635A6F|nr:GDSL esterase/lipase 1-like [Pistacia vera]